MEYSVPKRMRHFDSNTQSYIHSDLSGGYRTVEMVMDAEEQNRNFVDNFAKYMYDDFIETKRNEA